jgi:hypothetical protein
MLKVTAVDFDRPFQSKVSQILEHAPQALIVLRALAAAPPRRVLAVAGPSDLFEHEEILNTCDPPGAIRPVLGSAVRGERRGTRASDPAFSSGLARSATADASRSGRSFCRWANRNGLI